MQFFRGCELVWEGDVISGIVILDLGSESEAL